MLNVWYLWFFDLRNLLRNLRLLICNVIRVVWWWWIREFRVEEVEDCVKVILFELSNLWEKVSDVINGI